MPLALGEPKQRLAEYEIVDVMVNKKRVAKYSSCPVVIKMQLNNPVIHLGRHSVGFVVEIIIV